MSRVGDGSGSNYLEASATLAADTNVITLGAWVKCTESTVNGTSGYVLRLNANGGDRPYIGCFNITSEEYGRAAPMQNTVANTPTGSMQRNVWQCYLGEFSLTEARMQVASDSATATDTYLAVNSAVQSIIRSLGANVSMKVAHLWAAKRLLTSTERANLIAGSSPSDVITTDRWFYYPLTTSSLTNVWTPSGGDTAGALSVFGTVTADDADNPSVGGGSVPTVTDAGDEDYLDGESGIVVTGTNFGATQGAGKVWISPTDNVNDAQRVEQTVTSWGDTSITFTAVRGVLGRGNSFLFVTNNGGASNTAGHLVRFNARQLQYNWPHQILARM